MLYLQQGQTLFRDLRCKIVKNFNIISCIKGDNYSRALDPTIEIIYRAEDKQKGTVWLWMWIPP